MPWADESDEGVFTITLPSSKFVVVEATIPYLQTYKATNPHRPYALLDHINTALKHYAYLFGASQNEKGEGFIK